MKREMLAVGVIMAAAVGMGQAGAPRSRAAGAGVAASAPGGGEGSDAQPIAVLLEQGIYQEETAGNLDAAAKTYHQIAAQAEVTRGLAAQALLRLAGVQVKQKQMAEANKTLEQLRTEYPEQKDLIAKAEGLLPAGAAPAPEAARHVPTAEEKAEAEKLLAQGWQLMQERKFEDAQRLFSQAFQEGGTSAASAAIGWAKVNQGRPASEYSGYFKWALEADPKNAMALNGMGMAQSAMGNDNEAEQYWERALEVDPSATAVMRNLAQFAYQRGRYDDAIEWYQKWLKVDPQNADATIGLNNSQQMQAVMKDATAAANGFLKLMDEGQYMESWKMIDPASSIGQSSDAQQWETYLKTQRAPLGKVVLRRLDRARTGSTRPGRGSGRGGAGGFGGAIPFGDGGFAPPQSGTMAPGGIPQASSVNSAGYQFITQFEHKKDVYELITVGKADTGDWQVEAYGIQTPKTAVDPLRAR